MQIYSLHGGWSDREIITFVCLLDTTHTIILQDPARLYSAMNEPHLDTKGIRFYKLLIEFIY